MEADLASLGSGVEAVAKKVWEFEKNLKPAKKPEAEAEHELVKMVCASVRIISKTRGDKLFEPPSLKRFTKIFGLHAMLEKALKEKHAAEKGKIYPDLCWLLANLAHLGKWEGLANRLAQQVEMVRDVARLLNVEAKGKAVKTKLSKYLRQRRSGHLPHHQVWLGRHGDDGLGRRHARGRKLEGNELRSHPSEMAVWVSESRGSAVPALFLRGKIRDTAKTL